MTQKQHRLIQFAIGTLKVLETHIDWNAHTVYAIADLSSHLNLSREDVYLKSLATEDDDKPVHIHPFDQGELITLLEAARITLADSELFDGIADSLDISDDKLKALQEKLNNHLNH